MNQRAHQKHSSGFTLVETLIAFLVFALLIGSALNLFLLSVRSQKNALASQAAGDQSSFLIEYISRALRQARTDTTAACLNAAGLNYAIGAYFPLADGIRFLDGNGKCREFFLNGATGFIQERISTDETAGNLPASGEDLTADDITVTAFVFREQGSAQSDSDQPRVTFLIEARGTAADADEAPLRLQTTISQRALDIAP